jgi:serine/threonine protein phosphatase PrpC
MKRYSVAQKDLGPGQDIVRYFTTPGGDDFIELYDGHGPSWVINKIKEMQIFTQELISSFPDTMEEEIQKEIMNQSMAEEKFKVNDMFKSGTTFSLVHMSLGVEGAGHRLICRNTGDSTILLFKNRILVYKSPDHNCYNEKEMLRLKGKGSIKETNKPFILSPTSIIMKKSLFFSFDNNSSINLAPTQSLGHLGKTGLDPSVFCLEFNDSDEIKAVIASDGVWDMINFEDSQDIQFILNENANDIVDFAEGRWTQAWDLESTKDGITGRTYKNQYFPEKDDISCGVLEFVPLAGEFVSLAAEMLEFVAEVKTSSECVELSNTQLFSSTQDEQHKDHHIYSEECLCWNCTKLFFMKEIRESKVTDI